MQASIRKPPARRPRAVFLLAILLGLAPHALPAQENGDRAIEERIVQYLKEHVKPGKPIIVSNLINNVFKTEDERRVLNRLFNTVMRIPLFVAQYKASTDQLPSLQDIARQFNLPVDGEVPILLTILESDPRVPRFITRDSRTGEITAVDIEAVKKDPRFGKVLERIMAGWEGKPAPAFELTLMNGSTLSSGSLSGKHRLIYFWFSGCPPCVRIAPHLVELQRKYSDRNFTVIAINADRFLELQTTDQDRAAYMKKAGFSFPSGHLSAKIQESYGNVNVYPTLFLIDAKGTIRKHYVNYKPLSVLSADVEDVLQES